MLKEKSAFEMNLSLLKDKLHEDENDDKKIESALCQLRYIFSQTEEAWHENLKHLKGEIKYSSFASDFRPLA